MLARVLMHTTGMLAGVLMHPTGMLSRAVMHPKGMLYRAVMHPTRMFTLVPPAGRLQVMLCRCTHGLNSALRI